MTRCNYVALDINDLDPLYPLLDELFDLDLLRTEEGLFINLPEQE